MSRFGPEVVLDRPAFVDETARIFGRVTIGEGASVWPYAVIRAESEAVVVGPHSNVQDHAVLHVGDGSGTTIGAWCSIAHKACVHGATVGDHCLIGIGATLMDRVVLGENSIVAGHTILTEGTVVPPGSIVAGVPGKVIASRNAFMRARRNAILYWWNAMAYAEGRHRSWTEAAFPAFLERELARARAEHEARYGAPPPG